MQIEVLYLIIEHSEYSKKISNYEVWNTKKEAEDRINGLKGISASWFELEELRLNEEIITPKFID